VLVDLIRLVVDRRRGQPPVGWLWAVWGPGLLRFAVAIPVGVAGAGTSAWALSRRGTLKALVAVARFILVISWLADPTARYHDLSVEYHSTRLHTERRIHANVRGLQALAYTVSLTAAA
jgi:hypothetical protein